MTYQPPEQPAQNQPPQPPHPPQYQQPYPPHPPQYQQPYPPQVVYQQVVRAPSNGLATAAMVLGIIGLVFALIAAMAFLPPVIVLPSFILGVLAAILGSVAVQKARRIGVGGAAAKAGAVLGGVTVLILLLTFAISMIILASR